MPSKDTIKSSVSQISSKIFLIPGSLHYYRKDRRTLSLYLWSFTYVRIFHTKASWLTEYLLYKPPLGIEKSHQHDATLDNSIPICGCNLRCAVR